MKKIFFINLILIMLFALGMGFIFVGSVRADDAVCIDNGSQCERDTRELPWCNTEGTNTPCKGWSPNPGPSNPDPTPTLAPICTPGQWDPNTCARCADSGYAWHSSCSDYGPNSASPGNDWCTCAQNCNSTTFNVTNFPGCFAPTPTLGPGRDPAPTTAPTAVPTNTPTPSPQPGSCQVRWCKSACSQGNNAERYRRAANGNWGAYCDDVFSTGCCSICASQCSAAQPTPTPASSGSSCATQVTCYGTTFNYNCCGTRACDCTYNSLTGRYNCSPACNPAPAYTSEYSYEYEYEYQYQYEVEPFLQTEGGDVHSNR